ncbi:Glutathione S-transferase U9 [Acorus gramineus]|uniref:glutathione transferase n=1 Tax=Acorus gramineus TaxID=55184 RepID=A0AAV9ASW3_ACOGR|nr:Glutathione S-transferase U9 [Acorus gramineus]
MKAELNQNKSFETRHKEQEKDMETVQGELKLHGLWASPFCTRVELALKLKGVQYEYIQEDLNKKSDALLRYNPIHKMVPVLVHDGQPIVESLVILEYIDETWKEHRLMPKDPHRRARIWFWADYFDKKFTPACNGIIMQKGEEQEKAIKEFKEHLSTLEQGMEEEFPPGQPFFNGETLGLLDLVVCSTCRWFTVLGELVGTSLVNKETTPLIFSWIQSFMELQIVEDTLPQQEKLLAYALGLREKALNSLD